MNIVSDTLRMKYGKNLYIRNITLGIVKYDRDHIVAYGIMLDTCINTTLIYASSHGSLISTGIIVVRSTSVGISHASIAGSRYGIKIVDTEEITLTDISIVNLWKNEMKAIVDYGILVASSARFIFSNIHVSQILFQTAGLFIDDCNNGLIKHSNFSKIDSTSTEKHLLYTVCNCVT